MNKSSFPDIQYQRVIGWSYQEGGGGLFVATKPSPKIEELRALGRMLSLEFRNQENMAIMVFDAVWAARDASRGSRKIGEKRFQAALSHQKAMYFRQSARAENSFNIYDNYPKVREVIRF